MPKRVDHDERRAHLAELTVKVIEAEGAQNATLRRIAKEGGFTLGVITHYFRDKDDLVAFAFEWLAERSAAALEARLAAAPRGRARLVAALEHMVPVNGEASYPGVWLALWGGVRRTASLAVLHRTYYAHWRRTVRALVRAASPRPLSAAALKDAVDLIVTAIDGLWLGVMLEGRYYGRRRRRALIAALVERVVPGSAR
jgi:DNA-binding transcriptional regulator YbjK